MHSRRFAVVSGLVLTAIVCGALAPGAQAREIKSKPKVGDIPPDAIGRSAAGSRVRISDYRGKIVVLTFWASWCPPCRKELPVLVSIKKKSARDTLDVIVVNWRESIQQFRAIKRALKDSELTLVSDESGRLGKAFGVKAVPHLFIIGRDGKIGAIHIGYGESEIPRIVDDINKLWNAGNPGPKEVPPGETS